jgi:hypothetical protein
MLTPGAKAFEFRSRVRREYPGVRAFARFSETTCVDRDAAFSPLMAELIALEIDMISLLFLSRVQCASAL